MDDDNLKYQNNFGVPNDDMRVDAATAGSTGEGFRQPVSTGVDLQFIVQRAKDIITRPKDVWTAIMAEPETVSSFFRRYLAVMAAIPPVCHYIGMVVFGLTLPFIGTFRWPIIGGLITTIVTYATSLAMLYVMAKVVEFLAPKFGGSISEADALKTVGYALTPTFLGGFCYLIPALTPLAMIAGIYGLYVLYQGLSRTTGVPANSTGKFFAATLAATFVSAIVLFTVASAVTPAPPMPEVDTAHLAEGLNMNADEKTRNMENFQKAFQNGQAPQ